MQAHRGVRSSQAEPTLEDALLQLALIANLLANQLTSPVAAAPSRRKKGRQAGPPVATSGKVPLPLSQKKSASHFGGHYARIARAGLRGGVDDAIETAGSIAGSAFGPLGAIGGGLLARGLGGLLGLTGGGARATGARGQRGESPAQPVYVVMPGVSDLLAELVSLTRAAQLRSAGRGIDMLTNDLAVQNARAGLRE